ncbi:1,6-anhydro-N-acetylmuramyl-L-alanine amidase AmpD [Thalassotalea sp. PLHSN55]|uniref:1,6-anhydro-N-acetylmuramyl-L-alanine amidase AmpD n=1 Tax=Thalassotalea sp. PLHSN55 TaxID=3435888 RepID=UPI003F8405F7
MKIIDGWLSDVEKHCSPHFDQREQNEISLLVIHNISLPAGNFGGSYITDLFMGCLDAKADKSFAEIYQLRVSAHCLIRRDGQIVQYVPFEQRAWHAGVSNYLGREKCNDFSIGIELEGCDDIPYTDAQYQQLVIVTQLLQQQYPAIMNNIVGHNDIAPERKTDPGEAFDWQRYLGQVTITL